MCIMWCSFKIVLLLVNLIHVHSLEFCYKDDRVVGQLMRIDACPSIINDLKSRRRRPPKPKGYDGEVPIICCPDFLTTTSTTTTTTTTTPAPTTTTVPATTTAGVCKDDEVCSIATDCEENTTNSFTVCSPDFDVCCKKKDRILSTVAPTFITRLGFECGKDATCENFRFCPSVAKAIEKGLEVQRCNKDNPNQFCCPKEHVASTTTLTPITEGPSNDCPPLTPEYTSDSIGQLAWDKCKEYQEKYVYPCYGGNRRNNCIKSLQDFIYNGKDCKPGEFPHMALLGYAKPLETGKWGCGGSIISEKFILTAGHCTFAPRDGNVTHVSVGILNRTEINEDNVYKVKNIIKYPDYNPPNRYHDIALLEIEGTFKFSKYARPACLDIKSKAETDDNPIATGWGLNEKNNYSEILQKVNLDKFDHNQCLKLYRPKGDRKLEQGLDEATQVCFGDKTTKKDTCRGDSGGPLQVPTKGFKCMYTIIAVTSSAYRCGVTNYPGIYMRVNHYVDWIERNVWADEYKARK